jgi:hypothetical protein
MYCFGGIVFLWGIAFSFWAQYTRQKSMKDKLSGMLGSVDGTRWRPRPAHEPAFHAGAASGLRKPPQHEKRASPAEPRPPIGGRFHTRSKKVSSHNDVLF